MLGGGSPLPQGNLVKFEYFFDKDPGFGNGNAVSLRANPIDNNFACNLNLKGLTQGVHQFYIRATDDWGLTTMNIFDLTIDLPVSLMNFTGQLVQDQVPLNWQTASEDNNDHFEIDHSEDGIQFSSIGNVKGSGTASIRHNYSYLDTNPAEGNNYYHLKQVDLDRNYTFSSIIDVKLATGLIYKVYPNPAKNKVNIVISTNKDQRMVFTLSEASGKIIEIKTGKLIRYQQI